MVTLICASKRHVELLEKSQNNSCSKQIIVAVRPFFIQIRYQALETSLIEEVGNIWIEIFLDNAQVASRYCEDSIQKRLAGSCTSRHVDFKMPCLITEVKLRIRSIIWTSGDLHKVIATYKF